MLEDKKPPLNKKKNAKGKGRKNSDFNKTSSDKKNKTASSKNSTKKKSPIKTKTNPQLTTKSKYRKRPNKNYTLIVNQRSDSRNSQQSEDIPASVYKQNRNEFIDSNQTRLKKAGIVFHYDRKEKLLYKGNEESPRGISKFVRLSFALCVFIAAVFWLFSKIISSQ